MLAFSESLEQKEKAFRADFFWGGSDYLGASKVELLLG